MPHLERSTTVERHYHTWATALPWLKWPLGARGYLYLSPSSPTSLSASLTVQFKQKQKSASLSPPLVTLSSQGSLLISPSILKRKRCQTRLESRSTNSQTLKSTWFMFWPAVVFVTLGACQLVWQPREVCNHLLKLVNSPVILRVNSLDFRSRKGCKALSLSG